MSEKSIDKNIRRFHVVTGIFYILLSVALIINVGYVARALAFPFLYVFGFGALIIYLLIIFKGVCLIADKKFPFKKYHKYYVGGFLLILGALLVFTQIVVWTDKPYQNVFDVYNDRLFSVNKGYFNAKVIDIFGQKLAGGFICYFITYLFSGLIGPVFSMVICGAVTLIGLIIIFSKQIKNFFVYVGKQIRIYNKKRNPTKEQQEYIDFKETDIYQHAKEVGEDKLNDDVVSPLKPLDFSSRDILQESSIEFKQKMRMTGIIVKPSFKLSGDVEEEENDISESRDEEPFTRPMPEIDSEQVVQDNISSSFEEIENHEEENVDNDTNVDFDESIVTKQPEFIPPVETDIPAPTKVEENKIEKKKEIKWVPPSSELLSVYEVQEAIEINEETAEQRTILINKMFEDFKLGAHCIGHTIGPSITRFNIDYDSTGLVKTVSNLKDDISRRLNGVPIRFESTIPGYSYSGLEVPNAKITTVSFKEIFENLDDVKSHPLSVGFGKNISGEVVKADFDKFPHLLVSGTTGSGKSVFVNSVITTLIMRNSPDKLKLVLIDPKRVEFNKYFGIPHLLCPVLNTPEESLLVLRKLAEEMNDRYSLFAESDYVSDIKEYNEYAKEKGIPEMPYIIIIIDEYADLTDNCKDIAAPITSLSQKARAAGIHLLLATQRPTVNVITGTIKGNINTRVALSAASANDSMVVLDEGGAEKLLGNGDMLVKSPLISRSGPVRLQGCFIKGREIGHVTEYLKNHYELHYEEKFLDLEEKSAIATAEYLSSGGAQTFEDVVDEKYEQIKEWTLTQEYMSMSKIQRECSMGFNRAGRLLKMLQDNKIVSTVSEGSRGFKVLADRFNDSDIVTSSEQMIK